MQRNGNCKANTDRLYNLKIQGFQIMLLEIII
jgi:hypothetical protein